MKLIICFTLLGFKMVFGSVPDGNWSDWVEKGTALTKAGDHRRAVEAYQKALAQARVSALDALPLARIMSSLAGAYADAGEYAGAEFEWRQALTVVKKAEGADSLDYALLAATVGILPTQISARDSVVVVLRRALTIYEGTASAGDLAIVRAGLVS